MRKLFVWCFWLINAEQTSKTNADLRTSKRSSLTAKGSLQLLLKPAKTSTLVEYRRILYPTGIFFGTELSDWACLVFLPFGGICDSARSLVTVGGLGYPASRAERGFSSRTIFSLADSATVLTFSIFLKRLISRFYLRKRVAGSSPNSKRARLADTRLSSGESLLEPSAEGFCSLFCPVSPSPAEAESVLTPCQQDGWSGFSRERPLFLSCPRSRGIAGL